MSAAEKAAINPAGANHNLWQVAKLGDVNQLEQALARGADVNACNNLGLTPLMMAAFHGKKDMVKALVEHGADVNAVDNGGLTAAMLAEDRDHAEIVRMLVALGVKKKQATRQAEASTRSAKNKLLTVVEATKEVSTPKDPKARTLREPPEIWDLVHVTQPEFKPRSPFVEHVFKLHPLVLGGILVIIGCGVGFLFAALEARTNTALLTPQTDHNAASLPVTSDRINAKSPLNPNPPLSDPTPSSPNQELNKTPSSTDPASDTFDAVKNIEGDVAAKSLNRQHVTKRNNANSNHDSFESEANKEGARLSSLRPSKGTVALSKNKSTAAFNSQSEKEKEPTQTASKQPEKSPSPESISPAKPDPTPKPKVIPWP